MPSMRAWSLRNGRGVLLAGPSGSGKSTAALACAQAGFDYLADDHVVFEGNGTRYLGHSLFGSANLETNHLQRLADMSVHGSPGRLPEDEKSLLLVSNILPKQIASTASIDAIALPRVGTAQKSALRRASKVEASLRLAPSSLFLLPHSRGNAAAFEGLMRLIAACPTYWLELGQDLSDIAPQVDDILARSLAR